MASTLYISQINDPLRMMVNLVSFIYIFKIFTKYDWTFLISLEYEMEDP